MKLQRYFHGYTFTVCRITALQEACRRKFIEEISPVSHYYLPLICSIVGPTFCLVFSRVTILPSEKNKNLVLSLRNVNGAE